MIDDNMIKRINELSKIKKIVGLTEEELVEQRELRSKYIEAFKSSLRTQLDSIKFVDEENEK